MQIEPLAGGLAIQFVEHFLAALNELLVERMGRFAVGSALQRLGEGDLDALDQALHLFGEGAALAGWQADGLRPVRRFEIIDIKPIIGGRFAATTLLQEMADGRAAACARRPHHKDVVALAL